MIDPAERRVLELPFDITRHSRITISACGSAFYAGLVGRSWFEQIAQIPTDADIASEFRYRPPPLEADGLGILVSQSGETADTLAALKFMREQKQRILSIVNVPESSIARGSDIMLETRAGPEMSVEARGPQRPARRSPLAIITKSVAAIFPPPRKPHVAAC